MKEFSYQQYKESISKEMNNDNNRNLHSMTNMSSWLRYCITLRTAMFVYLNLVSRLFGLGKRNISSPKSEYSGYKVVITYAINRNRFIYEPLRDEAACNDISRILRDEV